MTLSRSSQFAAGLLVAVCLGLGIGLWHPLEAQPPQPQPQPQPAGAKAPAPGPGPEKVKHGRGHVTRPDLPQLVKKSIERHGPKLRRLPKITAAQWDTRTIGLVGPIQDQGQCGSCWDFSATDLCTSALYKATIFKNDGTPGSYLSQQYTLDCGRNGGCNGDDNVTVCQWAKSTGLPTQVDYGPYTARSGRCKDVSALHKITDWGFCTPANQNGVASTQDVKNAMVAYGPIGSAIDAGVLGDGTGIVSGSGHNIDHDIVLVGWDDTKGRNGCWILRNSWGTSWGVQGYCYIEYGSGDVGTEAVWAVAADPSPPPPPPPPQPPPTPPPPVPPGPGPTPPPAPGTPVTLTLTPDQVASVIRQSGAVTITSSTTLGDLLGILAKFKVNDSPKQEPAPTPMPQRRDKSSQQSPSPSWDIGAGASWSTRATPTVGRAVLRSSFSELWQMPAHKE